MPMTDDSNYISAMSMVVQLLCTCCNDILIGSVICDYYVVFNVLFGCIFGWDGMF